MGDGTCLDYLANNHLVIAWMVFQFKDGHHGYYYNGNETPPEILNKRYASGEISKDEFERMKKDLI